MKVAQLMRRDVVVIREDATLAEVCDVFQQNRVHGAPVVDENGRLVGFVSQEDVLFGSLGGTPSPHPSRVGGGGAAGKKGAKNAAPAVDLGPRAREIMTAPAVSAAESTELTELCRMMWRLRIHHVPIVRDGGLVGIVSAMDLCRAIAQGVIRG